MTRPPSTPAVDGPETGNREASCAAADPRFVRFLLHWHGIPRRRKGLEGVRRSIAQIQGIPVFFSELETALLPARVADCSPLQLDTLLGEGSLVWQGHRPAGRHDGELGLFLADDFPSLGRITVFAPGAREELVRDTLAASDSLDFDQLSGRLGGFPEDILRTLWKLAWNGEVTSDSLDALRALRSSAAGRYRPRPRPRYTTRRRIPPGSAGRWRLLAGPASGFALESERRRARARQSLACWGIVCRTMAADFDELVPDFEALAQQGAAQRGRWLEVDGKQFAAPGAAECWRASAGDVSVVVLSARDPANPCGALAPWPSMKGGFAPSRSPGARVMFRDGRLMGYLSPRGAGLHTPLQFEEPEGLSACLRQAATEGPVFFKAVDGEAPYETSSHQALVAAGFSPSRQGYLLRRCGYQTG